jgi:tetratricopeptide (TPR) repeat protein
LTATERASIAILKPRDSYNLEILNLNAAAYPNSPNVYDTLGEVYLAAGQKELARKNSEKALKVLRSDTAGPQDFRDSIKASAEQRLKQLDAAH